jgi:multisubunit Na+/H+ antiporter MnhB subunit
MICTCSAAIILTLTRYDAKPQPEFPFRLTLNALIQLITTIATLSVSTAVLGALSQVSWLIYKNQSRPLLDFDVHQTASHGGIGSLRLLAYLGFSLK